MTGLELFALLPLIVLTLVILGLLIQVAFLRNLALTCLVAVMGLVLTLAAIVWVQASVDVMQVTPLIVVDDYGLMFSALIVVTTALICLLAYGYQAARGERQEEFFVLMLLSALGGMTLAQSAHFASMVLGLELLGVAIYAMISYPTRGLFSLEAALKYLILSGVSSAIILFGIALLYAVLGSLSFSQMGTGLAADPGADRLFILVGITMLLAGMGFKLSLFPFHMWTPDVYEGAPAPVTAFLATVSKGGIFAVLFRFFTSVDGFQFETLMTGLYWIALLSIIVGNLLALMQSSIKRMLAYSSIAHLGYLFVAFIAAGIAGGRELAIEAVSLFLIAYFLTTIGAFGVVTLMSNQSADHDVDDLGDYTGLFWRQPLVATFFTVMLLSLAGIPLTAGFIGKFYIFAAGIDGQLWGLILALVIGSGIGLFYYLRVVYRMTVTVADDVAGKDVFKVPAAGGWAMAAVTVSLLLLGVYPAPLIEWVSVMARTMN